MGMPRSFQIGRLPQLSQNQTAFEGFCFKCNTFFPLLQFSWYENILVNSFQIPIPKYLEVKDIKCENNEMSICLT